MKATQITELFANIKNTFVSFFSILMFVALGVGIFLGISWSGPALENAAEKAFEKGSFHNFQIQFIYGLTDDDLAKLAELEGVSDVEGGWQSFQSAITGENEKKTVKVQTLAERIDTLTALEGELPAKVGEIALSKVAAEKLGFSVGDTITFAKDGGDDDLTAQLAALDSASGNATSAPAPDKDGMKYLYKSTYTVTALVESPEYIALDSITYGFANTPSGATDMLAWVPPASFDPAAFQNGYPVVSVACSSLDGLNTFSNAYKEQSKQIESRITELGDTLGPLRYDSLHDNIQAKIDNAEKQLEDGKAQIASGEEQLEQGRAELEAGKAEGRAKLSSAYRELQRYEALKQEGEAKLEQARAEVAEAEEMLAIADGIKGAISSTADEARAFKADQDAKLAAGEITQEQYDAALDEYASSITSELQPYASQVGVSVPSVTSQNFDDAIELAYTILDQFENIPIEYKGQTLTIGEARAKLADAKQKLAAGEAEYNQRVAQLEDGWDLYYEGQDELAELIATGEQKIADGERQLEEAKQKVAENEPKLAQAKEQFAAMKDFKWAVLSRAGNVGAVQITTFSRVTGNLSFSMAALFIIVGLLVSYSAVSRIVHEQITQIGTKKALGLRSREITISFLAYAGIAVICGAVIGTIVGILLVERIIGQALGSLFVFGVYDPYFGLPLFAIVTLLELVLVLGATWIACRGILKEHAVELLKGEKPPESKTRFYEKWRIWDRLPLLTQTIVNNCVNDKRRVFSTIVGVAGCTALIVTALTLNNDVLKSYDKHYEDVYSFNAITYADTSVDGAITNIGQTLDAQGAASARVQKKLFALDQPDGVVASVSLIVPEDESVFSQVYYVNPVSRSELNFDGEGVWVTQAYHDHFGANVGDVIKFKDTDGAEHSVPILGFYEFWLTYHEMIMGRNFYEKEFGAQPKYNVVLSDTHGADVNGIGRALRDAPGYDSITDDKKYQKNNFDTFSSVSSAVVLIYMALSVLMAIVVLLNLNVMFISEKKRDLIVLMINGFSVKAAKKYIYNDTIVLTIIGVILGVILGCIMGSITVASIEPTTATFVKSVDWIAVLVGVVGSSLLSLIMSVISLRRIPRFDLTDINRF